MAYKTPQHTKTLILWLVTYWEHANDYFTQRATQSSNYGTRTVPPV